MTRPASTSEIMGTERIRSPPTFATGSHFSHFTVLPHISRLNLKGGGGKKTGEGNGRNMGGDGERTEKEKEGDPPHPRYPPTFQPWLRLGIERTKGRGRRYSARKLPVVMLLTLILIIIISIPSPLTLSFQA